MKLEEVVVRQTTRERDRVASSLPIQRSDARQESMPTRSTLPPLRSRHCLEPCMRCHPLMGGAGALPYSASEHTPAVSYNGSPMRLWGPESLSLLQVKARW